MGGKGRREGNGEESKARVAIIEKAKGRRRVWGKSEKKEVEEVRTDVTRGKIGRTAYANATSGPTGMR